MVSSFNPNELQDLYFWWKWQVRFFYFYSSLFQIHFLSYIEIWENKGDLNTPNYQAALLDSPNDYQFESSWCSTIIRINHDQCEKQNP